MHIAAVFMLVTMGCVMHSADVSAEPVQEITEPSEPAQKLNKSVAKGRPTKFESGAPHGVWIWHDGKSWHVRTTTKSAQHRFTGRVSAGGSAEITGISLTKGELKDRVKLREKAVRFDFTTNGHADGFDFELAGSGCVRFAIEVDGERAPQMVHLGEGGTSPTSWHFQLCS